MKEDDAIKKQEKQDILAIKCVGMLFLTLISGTMILRFIRESYIINNMSINESITNDFIYVILFLCSFSLLSYFLFKIKGLIYINYIMAITLIAGTLYENKEEYQIKHIRNITESFFNNPNYKNSKNGIEITKFIK